jgi:putative DNA primase/helicase
VDRLTEAIEGVDLPGLVARLFPDSGAKPGRPGLYRAAWRGDRKPSLSLFKSPVAWSRKNHTPRDLKREREGFLSPRQAAR